MENNNPTPPPAPQPQQLVNQQPMGQPTQTPAPKVEGESHKMILWLVAGLILIIAVVGGVYLYMVNQQKGSTQGAPTAVVTQPESVDSLEKEVVSEELEDIDKQFQSVDKDIESL